MYSKNFQQCIELIRCVREDSINKKAYLDTKEMLKNIKEEYKRRIL